MQKKWQKDFISSMSWAVLLLIVSSCQIGIWNAVFPVSTLHVHVHNQKIVDEDCQPVSGAQNNNSAAATHSADRDAFTLPDSRLFLAVIFLGFFSTLLVFLLKFGGFAVGNYFKTIREKYGGFNLFHYFNHLFSSGLLNPKVF